MFKKIIWPVLFVIFVTVMIFFQPMVSNKVYHEELDFDILISNHAKKDAIKSKMFKVLEKIYHKKISQKDYTSYLEKESGGSNRWFLMVVGDKEKYQMTMDMDKKELIYLKSEFSSVESVSDEVNFLETAQGFWQLSEVHFGSGFIEENEENSEASELSYSVFNENDDKLAEIGISSKSGKIIYYQRVSS